MMQTIVLASQKGGSGKTTLASHLAVEAQAAGRSVVLVDTDPQGGLSDWWNVRAADSPALSVIGKGGLRGLLTQLGKAGVDVVIVDTPGQASADTEATIRMADLVIVPVKATPNDLRAVVKTVLVVNALGRPMIFVVNEAKAKTRLTTETAVELSQHGTVSPTIIHNRQDLAASMIDGRTAGELDPTGKSASEIKALWVYITQRLEMEKSFGTAA